MKRLPVTVFCPNCQARPGEPCTQPSIRGRRPVAWFHYARETRARYGGSDE